MKEPARTMNTCFNYNRVLCLSILIACGSFKTIPNSLRQLPAKNLITPEALFCWALLKLKLNEMIIKHRATNPKQITNPNVL